MLTIKRLSQKQVNLPPKKALNRWFNAPTPFSSAFLPKTKVGLLLGGILAFIIIALEPFDTNQFQSNYRYLLLLGFGAVLSVLYFAYSTLEGLLCLRFNISWSRKKELLSALLFVVISGTVIFLYNYLVVNQTSYSFPRHMWYYRHIVLPVSPIILLPFLWLRKTFGKLIVPLAKDSVQLKGDANDEELLIKKAQLLYIKSEQNYVTVYHLDEKSRLRSTLLRLTLSKSHEQVPFLLKCHRSYLINPTAVKEIQGNSQKARVLFSKIPDVVPLSKSYYKGVKEELSSL